MATPSTSSRPAPRRAVPLSRRIVLGLVVLAGVALTPVAASAAPRPATAHDAAVLMAARAHDLEKITEAFDAARDQLAAQEASAQAAAARADQARAARTAAQQQVRSIARSAYTGQNGALKALLTSKNADDFVGQVTTLDTIAGHQATVLDQVAAAGRAADQASGQAAKAVAAARATYESVARQQAGLQAEVNRYQAAFNALSAQEKQAAVAAAETTDVRASRDVRPEPGIGGGSAVAAPAPSSAAAVAVRTAMAERGAPYVWAAAGPGSFDCSGLMQYAWRAAGVSLPHSSLAQSQMGAPVSRNALQPGDLVFFYSPVSHVAMYIGGGNVVQAPTAGDVVKVTPLSAMPSYNSARRLG
jgi:cell wall-associated NlpC family hydrolase